MRLTYEQFHRAHYQSGYQYELIEGRLYVVTKPRISHDRLDLWLLWLLAEYADSHPQVINYVTPNAEVHVPGTEGTTCPEPDIAASHGFPDDVPDDDWKAVSPVLVVEVLSEGGIEKDLTRNVGLYLRVPSIREYWVLDNLTEPGPQLRVYRRRGGTWQVIEVGSGDTYETKLLPGFRLTLDPRS